MRVLVVDDSTVVRQRLVESVSALPGVEQVDIAACASDARRAIESTRPDLVILDIHMPGGSGLEVLDAMRTDDPPATSIVLTNDPTPQWRHACLLAGADFFFDKCSESQQALDIVARLALEAASRRAQGRSCP